VGVNESEKMDKLKLWSEQPSSVRLGTGSNEKRSWKVERRTFEEKSYIRSLGVTEKVGEPKKKKV